MMSMKLAKKRPGKREDPSMRMTSCPKCGSTGIEWKLTLEGGRHSYVCPDCGYSNAMVIETTVG